jgi:hypothetical protein
LLRWLLPTRPLPTSCCYAINRGNVDDVDDDGDEQQRRRTDVDDDEGV